MLGMSNEVYSDLGRVCVFFFWLFMACSYIILLLNLFWSNDLHKRVDLAEKQIQDLFGKHHPF